MAERVYLSIGEVLSLLQADFPDVTISKIRFLESQGLLDPERTPSGYRKFYETDVERLRWILRQQRENFLPLKVIKGRLLGRDDSEEDGGGGGFHPEAAGEAPAGPVPPVPEPVAVLSVVDEPVAPEPVALEPAAEEPVEVEPVRAEPEEVVPAKVAVVQGEPAQGQTRAAQAEPPAREGPRHQPPRRRLSVTDLPLPLSGASLTLEELASASGQSQDHIRDLERAGFIMGRSVADQVYYDEECLNVAELMGGFARFGIEPRHLRIYKNSAEREAGLFQQVIVPLLKQRNPEARQRAIDALEELSQLGERLRTTMLRQAIKGLTGG
jgi:DNA-binding transcriptional MerR regulator